MLVDASVRSDCQMGIEEARRNAWNGTICLHLLSSERENIFRLQLGQKIQGGYMYVPLLSFLERIEH